MPRTRYIILILNVVAIIYILTHLVGPLKPTNFIQILTKKVTVNLNDAKESMPRVSIAPPLKDCTVNKSELVGRIPVDTNLTRITLTQKTWMEGVNKGGWWQPSTCAPTVKVAVIIPYRKREDQLKMFIHHMHPFLQKQKLFYRLIIVEQVADDPFNRAGLLNIGFVESLKISPFDCFVFTDVDLLPEDDRNSYGCPTSPRHMSPAVSSFDYKLPGEAIFGGVCAFTKAHFEKTNRMSNMYFGWGGEDDDFYTRMTHSGFSVTRPSLEIGRYTMVNENHFRSSTPNPLRHKLKSSAKERILIDGIRNLKYTLNGVVEDPLVTFVKVQMKKEDYLV